MRRIGYISQHPEQSGNIEAIRTPNITDKFALRLPAGL